MNDPRESDDTVVVECDLRDPPEKVWRALTDPDLVAEWLMPLTGEGPGIDCEVIESRPNRLLRYGWRDRADEPGNLEADAAGARMERDALDSIVTFELTRSAAGGTHLRIVHTAFQQTPALAMAA
ncbi:MAG TPA: SRPBCC domain-containing protein [Steroidobacteraceae bacterium]|nr:SRPBCC domain-containing protein [Steroidobacteraceae bacterium]